MQAIQRIQAPTAKFLVTIGVGIASLSIGAGAATALEAEFDVEAPYGFVGPIGIAVTDSGWTNRREFAVAHMHRGENHLRRKAGSLKSFGSWTTPIAVRTRLHTNINRPVSVPG